MKKLSVKKIQMTIWSIVVITGILVALHTITGLHFLMPFRIIHVHSAIQACFITIGQLIQHRRQVAKMFRATVDKISLAWAVKRNSIKEAYAK